MSLDPTIQNYLDFMQWFERQHPELHGAYWASISIPAGGKKVKVSHGKLEGTTIKRIKGAIDEYYDKNDKKNQGM